MIPNVYNNYLHIYAGYAGCIQYDFVTRLMQKYAPMDPDPVYFFMCLWKASLKFYKCSFRVHHLNSMATERNTRLLCTALNISTKFHKTCLQFACARVITWDLLQIKCPTIPAWILSMYQVWPVWIRINHNHRPAVKSEALQGLNWLNLGSWFGHGSMIFSGGNFSRCSHRHSAKNAQVGGK